MDEQEAGQVRRDVPVEWRISADLPTPYATNFVAQISDHEFFIHFFIARPPFLLGTDEERRRQLASVVSIPADCVARLVVAPGRIPELIQVLQETYDRYQKRFGEGES